MATYEIPAEPDTDRVWLLDHPRYECPIQADRFQGKGWSLSTPGGFAYYTWPELLALGTVTDVDPDDVSWLPPTPWCAGNALIEDSLGHAVMEIDIGNDADDTRLAALIVRLVNEHVARQAGAS